MAKRTLSTVTALTALSPLDGRYYAEVGNLADYCSEAALLRYRLQVECEYFIALSLQPQIKEVRRFHVQEITQVRALYQHWTLASAERIKTIEQTTKHDVKAVEYFIKEKLQRTSLRPLLEFVHFGLTSEDINNLAYGLMWRDAIKQVYLPAVRELERQLHQLARRLANVPLLSLTHGQPATPTTVGKELRVVEQRLREQRLSLQAIPLPGKLNGATGTWGALQAAYPTVNWLRFTEQFVRRLGLTPQLLTTQIEPHDRLAQTCQALVRLNTIVKDFDQDMWHYISRGLFIQKNIAGEIGSSAMPHKINPIYFENSEGNAGLANAVLSHLAEKLPVSRMQRDLTDSTVLRNSGMALGHSVLALKQTLRALKRVAINKKRCLAELNEHWEILAEPIQTVMRRYGQTAPYEQLKTLTRGHTLTQAQLHQFINTLQLPVTVKIQLKKLTPQNYLGLAARLARLS